MVANLATILTPEKDGISSQRKQVIVLVTFSATSASIALSLP